MRAQPGRPNAGSVPAFLRLSAACKLQPEHCKDNDNLAARLTVCCATKPQGLGQAAWKQSWSGFHSIVSSTSMPTASAERQVFVLDAPTHISSTLSARLSNPLRGPPELYMRHVPAPKHRGWDRQRCLPHFQLTMSRLS